MKNENLAALSDAALIGNLEQLSQKEAESTVEVILHLGEVEYRRLYAKLGFSSLFDYAVRKLRYAEGAAVRRISASRAVRQFPDLVPLLISKELSLTTLPKGVQLEAVFEEALTVLVNKLSPKRREERRAKGLKKFNKKSRVRQVQKSQKATPSTKEETETKPSRHIPARVRDEVYNRDGGRCSYISPDGIRCCSRHDLECHHEVPFARGGLSAAHNRLAADKDFGRELMARFSARSASLLEAQVARPRQTQ